MYITRIALTDFGKFEQLTADFSPGLNLIKGPNEAGKSTLADAVTTALFIDPVSEKEKVSASRKWGDNQGPILEALLNVDGHNYKLKRDFVQGKSSIEPEKTGMPGGDFGDINSWLSDKIGMPSDEVFQSTACVNQGEIDHIDDSIEAIKDKLESLATRGKEEQAASSTIKKIKEQIELLKNRQSEGSALLVLEQELQYNIDKLERDITTLKGKRIDLIQVETANQNLREDLHGRKKKLEYAEKAGAVIARADELMAEIDKLQKQITTAKEILKKVEGLKSQYSGLKRISKDDLGDIEQTDSSLNHLRPKCAELEEDTREAEEDLASFKVGSISIALTLIGLAGTGFFTAYYYIPALTVLFPFLMPNLWYFLGGSGALFALGISFVLSRKQHKSYLRKKVAKYSGKLETFRAEIEERESKLNTMLENYLVTSVDELKKNQWKFEELEKQIETETAKYNETVAGNTLSNLEKRLEDLQTESQDMAGENEKLSQYFMEGADLQKQKLVVNEMEERMKDLEREKSSLLQQIEMAEGGSELLASYIERMERLKQEREAITHKLKILELTLQCIEEARQNVLISKLEILNNRTSEILDGLTGSRYSKVRFDKSNLKFQVWSDEKGDWVDPEKWLSAGTVDQIYLAARLALSDLISEEKNSILILDDPFSSYDSGRLENAMKVLKSLALDHQIFLLTSHDYYDKWADSTITLK